LLQYRKLLTARQDIGRLGFQVPIFSVVPIYLILPEVARIIAVKEQMLMLNKSQILDLIKESLMAVNDEKKLGEKIPVSNDTILIGKGTLLDSLDFILLITNVEERVSIAANKDIHVSTDIEVFQEDNPFNTMETLVDHIFGILETAEA